MLQQPSFSVHHHHITTPTVANADINFSPNALDNDIKNTNSVNTYHDTANNFTFTLTRKNGTAYISPVQTEGLTELKIGVLLPFHQQDNNWTKTITLSGASAVRMAIAEINTKQIIPGAYITLIEQDSFPKDIEGQAAISQAVYSAISLIHEGVVAIIGDISSSWTTLSALMSTTLQIPQCSFSAVATSLSDKSQYGYFFRTIPTDLIYADAALSFIVSQGWPTIGVLYSGDDFGKQLSTDVIMKARAHNIIIKGYQSFYDHGPTSDIQSSIDTLMATGARVIFVAAADDAPMAALIVAAHSGYINNDNVWLTIGIQSDSLQQNVINFNNIISTRADSAEWTSQSSASQSSASQSSASSSVLPNIDPVLYAANTTRKLTHIEYNSTFSGGVFSFESIMSLPGYPPFDQFLQRWSSLDPAMYVRSSFFFFF
ncbi:periplasmic binding protein-like I [Halteromyces radiatus]|uniref:periplasmic binding protein-like I n=1 Tax=Halteromyces radiatus TaxID=101107 RepID=UPI0022209B27|nr:periplasmic binding protein-like I [Halteromyces radiatus]KAI8097085.1 periplasmic binding protein-like I [Halteromyces radiatus]